MKTILMLMTCLSIFFSVNATQPPIHYIADIYEEGRYIQLDDGSIWAIGYWPKNAVSEVPVVKSWQLGDPVEFYTKWNGINKVWYFITNMSNESTVSAYLWNTGYDEASLHLIDINQDNILILSDGSRWNLKHFWFFNWALSMSTRLHGNLLVIKKYGDTSYYLINTSTLEGSGHEVILVDEKE
jgi:hypothetical protein